MNAVESLKEAGYTVKDACAGLGISRSSYYAKKKPKPSADGGFDTKERVLVEKIKLIKTEHPFWGYRRIWAWLRHREKILVNQKRVRRLMKENGLMMSQANNKAKRTPKRSKLRADRPKQIWGIDTTKFIVNVLGWVYLGIVLDWFTKKVVGWYVSLRSKAADWKCAMDMAINREFPYGVRGAGLNLISDNGSQPTAMSFMKDMANLEIEQIFASYDNPKGNADTERMIRTIKEELSG